LIFVVDPSNLDVLWYSQGNTQAQHDAEFIGNNQMIVFNNSFDGNNPEADHPSNFSSIRMFDFSAREWSEIYNAKPANGFSKTSGEIDFGTDGELMLNLTLQGRYLEVSRTGNVLSEFVNVRDAESIYWTKHAQYLTDQQFQIAKDLSCQK
jgi:hypothetical protein